MQPNPQETAYLVTFTEEILNGELHFLWLEADSNLSGAYKKECSSTRVILHLHAVA